MKIMMEAEQIMMRGDFAVRMLGGMEKSEEDEGMLTKCKGMKKIISFGPICNPQPHPRALQL